MTKNILVETQYPRLSLLESEDPARPLRISGIAAVADEVNGNHRLYPYEILQREVAKVAENLDSSNHVGMVDHPDWTESVSSIGLKFTKLYMDGKDVRFEAEIVPTSRGKDLEAVIRSGIRVGISSRGEGSVKHMPMDGKIVDVIQDDFVLYSYDAVVTPAVANARILHYESVQKALQQVFDKDTNNSEKAYNDDADSVQNTTETLEMKMNKTTEELIRLVKQHVLDEKDAAGITPANEVDNEEPREQVWADPSDNPNEQPNPQPDPMNSDTSPLTHTTENPGYVPVSGGAGDHPDPAMGAGAVEPEAAHNTTTSTGLASVKGTVAKTDAKNATDAAVIQADDEGSLEGVARKDAPHETGTKTDSAETSLRELLSEALNRESEITTLKNQLAEAQADAGIVAALAALSTSISDHLSKGNYSIVSNLASVASTLSWYATADEKGYYDTLNKNRTVDAILVPMARLAERVVRDEKILALTAQDRYGRTIAARLRDRATSAEQAEQLFESVKDQVHREASGQSDATPKGQPLTTRKYTDEQIRLRELAGIKED